MVSEFHLCFYQILDMRTEQKKKKKKSKKKSVAVNHSQSDL